MSNVAPGRELYIAVSQKFQRRMLSRFLDRYDDHSCDAEVLSTWLLKQVHRAQQVDARLALPREAATASIREPYDVHSRAPSSGRHATQHAFHASRGKPADTPNACFKCDGNHLLSQCPAFTAMSVREPWDLVKPTPLCICCLRPSHHSMSCSGTTCTKCNGKHHALLYFDKFSSNKLQQKQSNSSNIQGKVPVKEQVLHACRFQPRQTSLPAISFMTVPVTVRNGSQETVCRALLDPASTSTYIKAAVAEAIGLTGDPEPLQVTTLGGSQIEAMRRRTPVTIQSTDCSLTHQISAWVLPCVTADTMAVDWCQHQDAWTHLHGIPFPTMNTGDIGLLIGVDATSLHTALEEL